MRGDGIGLRLLLIPVALILAVIVVRGGLPLYLVAGALGLWVAGNYFAKHLAVVFAAWIAVEGLAFPFLRYPLNHDVLTFDRFIVPALGVGMLFTARRELTSRGDMVVKAFALFVVAYGLRAFLTHSLPSPPGYGPFASYTPESDWLDQAAIPFIVFCVAAQTTTGARWQRLCSAIVFLGVTVAVLGILEWLFGFNLSTESGFVPFLDPFAGVVRVGGPYPDPSTYGGVLTVCTVVTAYWMQARRAYLIGGAALAVEVLGLAPSFTKTIWGAAFVALVVVLGIRRGRSSRAAFVGIYGAIVVGVLYALLQNQHAVAERVTGSNANVVTRVGDYAQGLLIWQHWPWFGAGIQQFIPAQALVHPVTIGGIAATPSAHNTFISVLAEAGLFGFLPLLFLVYAIVALIRACRRWAITEEEQLFSTMVLAAAIGYFLISMTLVEIYYPEATVVLALVLGAAAGRMAERRVSVPATGPVVRKPSPSASDHARSPSCQRKCCRWPSEAAGGGIQGPRSGSSGPMAVVLSPAFSRSRAS